MSEKLIVIDDSRAALAKITAGLKAGGFDVKGFTDPEAALEMIDTDVDCVITDYEMPKVSGCQVCSKIRSQEQFNALPIIVLTSKEDARAILKSMDAGADDYVMKSVAAEVLCVKVRSLIKIKGLREKEIELKRFEAIKEMVITYNHEINNPLAVAVAHVGLIEKRGWEACPDSLEKIKQNLDRISEVVKHIKELKDATTDSYGEGSKMITIPQKKPA